MQQNLVEVVEVALLRYAHSRVGVVRGELLDEWQSLASALREKLSIHEGHKARKHHRLVRCVQVRLMQENDVRLGSVLFGP